MYKERRVAAVVPVFASGGEDVSSKDGAVMTAALTVICLETDRFEIGRAHV